MKSTLRAIGMAPALPAVAFFIFVVASDAHLIVVLVVGSAIAVGFGVSLVAAATTGWMSGLAIVALAYVFAAVIATAWVGSCPNCMHNDIQRRYWIDDLTIGLTILFGTSMASALAGAVVGDAAKRLTSRSAHPSG
jgi:hypothetical protein